MFRKKRIYIPIAVVLFLALVVPPYAVMLSGAGEEDAFEEIRDSFYTAHSGEASIQGFIEDPKVDLVYWETETVVGASIRVDGVWSILASLAKSPTPTPAPVEPWEPTGNNS